MQPVDSLGGDLHRRVEAEGEIGAGEIVVDGLRHTHQVDSHLVQLGGHAEGVLAADGHHRAHVERAEVADHHVRAARLLERVGPAGAEDGATQMEDAAGRFAGETEVQGRVHQTAPALPDAHHLEAVLLAAPDHRTNHRIETRAVSTAGQDRDLHGRGKSQDAAAISSSQECRWRRVIICTGPKKRSFSV